MGLLSKLFGGAGKKTKRAHFKKCDICGKPIEVTGNMSIFTATPNETWSIDGTAGYCPSCSRYLCSDHLEFRNTTGESFGPWEIGCKSCNVSIQNGP